MALIVHCMNGAVVRVIEDTNTTSSDLAGKFPFGDVYVRFLEPQGLQWRVLQRGTRIDDMRSFFDVILPIKVDQLPKEVQLIHACTT